MCQELISLDPTRIYEEQSDLQLAHAYERLGIIYFTKSMLGLAMENFVQAQALLLKYPSGANHEMARLFNNIGTVLHKQGEYNEAINSFRKAVDLFNAENSPKKEHRLEQALYQENFGFELAMNKEFDESIFHLKKAYVQKMHILGEKHSLLAQNLLKMGIGLNKAEKPNKALKFLDRALQMQLECQSKEIENLPIYEEQANSHLSNNDLTQALSAFSKSLILKKQLLSEDNISYVSTHVLQGTLFKLQKTFIDSIRSFESALEILKKRSGFQHPEIPHLYQEIGNIYLELSVYEKAAENYSKCLKTFGDGHNSEDEQVKMVQNLLEKCKKLQRDSEHKNKPLTQIPIDKMQSPYSERFRDTSFATHSFNKSAKPKKSFLLSACGMCGGS